MLIVNAYRNLPVKTNDTYKKYAGKDQEKAMGYSMDNIRLYKEALEEAQQKSASTHTYLNDCFCHISQIEVMNTKAP